MKINCPICNSTNINSVEKWQRTVGPKSKRPLMPRIFISHGYKFDRHTCECGNVWDVRK